MKKQIDVIDNFLNHDEVCDLYNLLKSPGTPWFIGTDHDKTKIKNKSFVKGYNSIESYSLVNDCVAVQKVFLKIKEKNIKNTENLIQIYFNCIKPGDKFDFHRDSDGKSVLVYLNPVWKFWWSSGTQFKSPNKIVRPKPGRVIIFDGDIQHRCISPNNFMEDFGRLSIVFQFKK